MGQKTPLARVRDALTTAANLLSLHSSSGKGQIGKAERKIQEAKTEIDNYIHTNSDESYEDVF